MEQSAVGRVPRSEGSGGPAIWVVAAAVTAAAWVFTIADAREMSRGMPMPGGWTMSMAWMVMPGQSLGAAAAMFIGMWAVMMVAMMLPSTMPVVMLYRRLAVARRARGVPVVPEAVLLAGYFLVWIAFGAVAFAVGMPLANLTMRSGDVSRAVPALTGAALLLAGIYQLTPLKQVCLTHCRSPLSFFTSSWREGWMGALRLGLHHGAWCAACCWALMLIQMVLGVMNLAVMLLVAVVIGLEKTWRHGPAVARVAGVAAIVTGGVQLLRAMA